MHSTTNYCAFIRIFHEKYYIAYYRIVRFFVILKFREFCGYHEFVKLKSSKKINQYSHDKQQHFATPYYNSHEVFGKTIHENKTANQPFAKFKYHGKPTIRYSSDFKCAIMAVTMLSVLLSVAIILNSLMFTLDD